MTTRTSIAMRLVLGIVVASALAMSQSALAQESAAPAQYEEGVHYHRLPVVVAPQDLDRIEVTEVFSYACIHCYTFDPILEEWREELPDDVAFRRVPAIFNETWALLARVYYAAESLGVGEQMHMPLFEAIHRRGVDIRKPELVEQLFRAEGGVSAGDLKGAMESFGVATRLRQADAQGRMYRVTGVPTLIVNGKFRIGSGDAGGYEGMLRIADFLIDLERTAAETLD